MPMVIFTRRIFIPMLFWRSGHSCLRYFGKRDICFNLIWTVRTLVPTCVHYMDILEIGSFIIVIPDIHAQVTFLRISERNSRKEPLKKLICCLLFILCWWCFPQERKEIKRSNIYIYKHINTMNYAQERTKSVNT